MLRAAADVSSPAAPPLPQRGFYYWCFIIDKPSALRIASCRNIFAIITITMLRARRASCWYRASPRKAPARGAAQRRRRAWRFHDMLRPRKFWCLRMFFKEALRSPRARHYFRRMMMNACLFAFFIFIDMLCWCAKNARVIFWVQKRRRERAHAACAKRPFYLMKCLLIVLSPFIYYFSCCHVDAARRLLMRDARARARWFCRRCRAHKCWFLMIIYILFAIRNAHARDACFYAILMTLIEAAEIFSLPVAALFLILLRAAAAIISSFLLRFSCILDY